MGLRTRTYHRWRDIHRNFSIHLINIGNIWEGWRHQYLNIYLLYKRIYQYSYESLLTGVKFVKFYLRIISINKQNKVGLMKLKLQTIC